MNAQCRFSSQAEARREIEQASPWFYRFELPWGGSTGTRVSDETLHLHETRWRMVESVIRAEIPSSAAGASILDVGCHEGWFAARCLKDVGVARVLGVDVRESSLDRARMMHAALGLEGAAFLAADAEELDGSLGAFDVSLCIGLIYHLESPMRVLRRVGALTRRLLLVETQLVDPIVGTVEWGRRTASRSYHAGFAIVDESFGHHSAAEAGATPLALCPTAEAVEQMLRAVGFDRVWRVAVPEDGHEQLLRGKRGVFAAARDA